MKAPIRPRLSISAPALRLASHTRRAPCFTLIATGFLWSSPVGDVNASHPGTAAVLRVAYAADRNPDVGKALLAYSSPDESGGVPDARAGDLDFGIIEAASGFAQQWSSNWCVRTNTSGQIRSGHLASNANASIQIATFGSTRVGGFIG
jgi:hypothetical protein